MIHHAIEALPYLVVWVFFFIRILYNRLDKYLEKNNIICPEQIGFRKGCRTSDHVFTLKTIRDRPFNLKGGYGFLLRSEFFFPTTRVRIYFFFCRAKREFFFQISTLRYMTKTLNQIFFFLHQNQNIFFSNIGNQNIFWKKTITPPSS